MKSQKKFILAAWKRNNVAPNRFLSESLGAARFENARFVGDYDHIDQIGRCTQWLKVKQNHNDGVFNMW